MINPAAVRAASIEFRDATVAYDVWQATHDGEEPTDEISERLSQAYDGFGKAVGFGFACNEDPVAELLIQVIPVVPTHIAAAEHRALHRYLLGIIMDGQHRAPTVPEYQDLVGTHDDVCFAMNEQESDMGKIIFSDKDALDQIAGILGLFNTDPSNNPVEEVLTDIMGYVENTGRSVTVPEGA